MLSWDESAQMITCQIELTQSTTAVFVSFIYGYNCKYRRRQLWDELRIFAQDSMLCGKPWAALGDFNQILSLQESSTCSMRISRGISNFRDCVNYAGLFDRPLIAMHLPGGIIKNNHL